MSGAPNTSLGAGRSDTPRDGDRIDNAAVDTGVQAGRSPDRVRAPVSSRTPRASTPKPRPETDIRGPASDPTPPRAAAPSEPNAPTPSTAGAGTDDGGGDAQRQTRRQQADRQDPIRQQAARLRAARRQTLYSHPDQWRVPPHSTILLPPEDAAELDRMARAFDKGTDLSGFGLYARDALAREPERAARELDYLAGRLGDPENRAQIRAMIEANRPRPRTAKTRKTAPRTPRIAQAETERPGRRDGASTARSGQRFPWRGDREARNGGGNEAAVWPQRRVDVETGTVTLIDPRTGDPVLDRDGAPYSTSPESHGRMRERLDKLLDKPVSEMSRADLEELHELHTAYRMLNGMAAPNPNDAANRAEKDAPEPEPVGPGLGKGDEPDEGAIWLDALHERLRDLWEDPAGHEPSDDPFGGPGDPPPDGVPGPSAPQPGGNGKRNPRPVPRPQPRLNGKRSVLVQKLFEWILEMTEADRPTSRRDGATRNRTR